MGTPKLAVGLLLLAAAGVMACDRGPVLVGQLQLPLAGAAGEAEVTAGGGGMSGTAGDPGAAGAGGAGSACRSRGWYDDARYVASRPNCIVFGWEAANAAWRLQFTLPLPLAPGEAPRLLSCTSEWWSETFARFTFTGIAQVCPEYCEYIKASVPAEEKRVDDCLSGFPSDAP